MKSAYVGAVLFATITPKADAVLSCGCLVMLSHEASDWPREVAGMILAAARISGESPDVSRVMPSLIRCNSSQSLRNQMKLSIDCCSSAMIASVARMVRSEKVARSASEVSQMRSIRSF